MIVLAAPRAADRRFTDQRHSLVATAQVRLMILLLLFAAGISLVLARLAWLGIVATPDSVAAGTAVGMARGDIVDRNGATLARTIDAWSIGVHPDKVIGDKVDLARRLAEMMPEHSAAYYHNKLMLDASFTYLKHRAMPELVTQVNALGEPGIAFAREPERLYPQTTLAAHALGIVNFDGQGVRGIERHLNDRLTNPALNSEPVALSIDLRVQGALESELGHAMATFQARGAAGLILDVATGEVMAMTSLPSFNPNKARGGEDELRNNVTQSVYELGSTFKPLTMAEAIETGVVPSMSKRFDATAPIQVGRFRIRDDHAQNRWLNVPETLVHSSNIATARIADEMGQARMEHLFRKLGFNTAPDIEIEKSGTIWPKFWARTTTMTSAYGHGIAITPLHLASAYAAMVNGGIWRPATLMKIAPGKAPAGRRVFSESTSARMRQLLRLVVLEGTGRKGDAPGFRIGAKTGTAERPDGGGYNKRVNVSTFAAAFPMDAPRYVVVAMLDSPKGTAETFGFSTAAWNAAPVVSRLVMRTGPMLGVIPDMNRDIDVSELMPLLWKAPGERKAAQ
ncbi:peptidoglycan D,D-transpeptidase FtsI family protein [Sphingomonas japonica]|uniref:Cell division protein FtsI (Penicillin-binding protein 3) n=1 Tax=Sphingomonas japonica TaxID=511662 RepID=A0ABX0U3D3_9SPHN|nr:penicillin-binding protein 2 [Sphingomonas japonica]NIJ24259.1 cell division protein FtsI (penicillin-binding protein 3) [Sphingomonas japonica]